jgi:biopolymer transport protein ExbD
MFRYSFVIISLLSFGAPAMAADHHPVQKEKIITIRVMPNGNIYMDKDTLTSDMLGKILQERLWKSYTGTGKMYSSIKLIFEGEVLMGTKGAVLDAIKDAQQKALTELCLQKHKKTFDSITSRQKNKIRKQFPVLFQEQYW